ncbi:prepilin-type N-terminal cleavage/methylation domain-containing protein [Amphritea sp. HPY]|uniref:prepilin-type N-terminal cleavage/methylation domain-containing protein n=1 Tax=Amphritea sp. HPY TaxID=3421652 RepID=UPI003D7CAD6A
MKNKAFERIAQSGFTLLELLIALMLTGLLTVLVYGGLQIGMSSWEKVTERNEEVSDAFLAQRFLRRLLATARPELVIDSSDATSSVGFLGLENELLFVASLPRFDEEGPLLWIYLTIRQDFEDIARLEMITAPYDSEEPVDWDLLLAEFRGGQAAARFVLAEGAVEQIEFGYLDIEEDSFIGWQPEWRFLPMMPAAIQIRFLSEQQRIRGWPDLVVIPREPALGIREAR